ncbi:YggS family pyridoxal phosphate-dependent enzyme [Marinivivus vitaminiproducens]|uniref:YggS family pyridoxal phosphate-dependent enzyme n=1 Tax=Marinivivus vitaminiproducens TaxID=3035935 RepID=UPI003FA1613D
MSENPQSASDVGAAAQRLDDVRKRMDQAVAKRGQGPAVELIAVSKGQGRERIKAALDAGQRVFGENYVQEAQEHWADLASTEGRPKLHLIGALQSNKAKEAVGLFDVIHSLDRAKLARALAKAMADQDRRPDLLIQVNTGEEPQKAGCLPGDLPELVRLTRDELGLPLVGLMCIPPENEESALHFAFLAKLAAGHGLGALSMGMSADYETAILFGATYVRVGTAIFGPRQPR